MDTEQKKIFNYKIVNSKDIKSLFTINKTVEKLFILHIVDGFHPLAGVILKNYFMCSILKLKIMYCNHQTNQRHFHTKVTALQPFYGPSESGSSDSDLLYNMNRIMKIIYFTFSSLLILIILITLFHLGFEFPNCPLFLFTSRLLFMFL